MGIYRNDQAQWSIASEAAKGGYAEKATGTDQSSSGGGSDLNGAVAAGSLTVTLTAGTSYLADEYIQIGTLLNAEIRRIRSVATHVLTLYSPVAFYHVDAETCNQVIPSYTVTSHMTHIPGIWESISVPDMTPEIMPQYFLGANANRNPHSFLRGKQSFAGSVSNMIVLNGEGLGFALGTVATTGTAVSASTTFSGLPSGTSQIGAMSILTISTSANFANNDYVQIGTGVTSEVRQLTSTSGSYAASAETFFLNKPLLFEHASGETVREVIGPYTHTVNESTSLQGLSWSVVLNTSDEVTANRLIRNYIGGKVNRATFTAEEGGFLRLSYDDVQFIDMVHNQSSHSGYTGELPKYEGAVGTPSITDLATEPYYFSQGTISIAGVEFARIKNFSIEVNNNIEAQYYVQDSSIDRTPFELLEGRREYRMSASIGLPDAAAATSTASTLFKELILEGNYTGAMVGFDVVMTFTRGTNETITFTSPSVAEGAAGSGGLNQGAFITSASHNLGTDALVSVDVEMLTRSLGIVIVDAIAIYP